MDRNVLKLKIQNQKIKELSSSNKQMPSAFQVTKNLTNSLIKNTKSVLSGNSLNVTDEEKNKRFEICKACDFFEPVNQKCSKCGCYMSIKTYLKAENCPIGKW